MAIPAIIGILSKVLGGISAAKGLSQGNERDPNKLQFEKRNMQQQQPATVGDVTGAPQAGQQPSGWDKFQGGANKAMTIASILGSLRNAGGSQQQPYMMQFNRRR